MLLLCWMSSRRHLGWGWWTLKLCNMGGNNFILPFLSGAWELLKKNVLFEVKKGPNLHAAIQLKLPQRHQIRRTRVLLQR